MNWKRREGRWMKFTGSARAHWSKLTDDDWKAITGSKEQLAARIQQRYGISREAAGRQIDAWSSALLDIVEPVRAGLHVERSAKQRRSMAAAVEPSSSKNAIK
jgi:uncharacterized protein YjbJ (UPF0337 family)